MWLLYFSLKFERTLSPTFGFIVLKMSIYVVFFFSNLYIEPVGFKSPTLSSDFEGTRLRKSSKNAIVLLCQSQGYPVPEFR